MSRPPRPTLPLAPLPSCTHADLRWIAPSIGHTGDLYRCARCGGYTMRGKPNIVRN